MTHGVIRLKPYILGLCVQTLREIANCIFGLLTWLVFIFGPYTILVCGMPWLALAASSVSLAAFTISFRWRNGFVLIIGCLGMLLLMHNTLTIGGAFALMAKDAGLNRFLQVAFGFMSIPFVYLLTRFVDGAANVILGPLESTTEGSKPDVGQPSDAGKSPVGREFES